MTQPTIQQSFSLALQQHQAGRLQEAQQLYQQILDRQPQHAGALHYLGVLEHQQGRNDAAVDLIRKAIAVGPDQPEPYNNLGLALRDTGRVEEAITALQQALALRPDYPIALCNLGICLQSVGKLDEAIAAFRRALGLRADYAEAYNGLGAALGGKGQIEEAIAAFGSAIALRSDYVEAHLALGGALRESGQLDAAIAAYEKAITLNPDFAEAHNTLGCILVDAGRLDEGFAAYRRAIALKPDFAECHSNLAFSLHFHPASDAKVIALELGRWNRQHAAPLAALAAPHLNCAIPDRRLRIGYVSPNFRKQTVGYNLVPLIQQHDSTQFEITCYSSVSRPDSITSEFERHADRWHDSVEWSDEQMAAQIRDDQIDILVDLALHTANSRLLVFARKPAPVQVTFAGYPGSTGLTAIDYRLSDPYLDPPGMDESVYSERTVRLPDSFWCYDPLDCRDVPVCPLQAIQRGFVVFGCLNDFCKINEEILKLWAAVMREVPRSHLLLLAPQGGHRQRTLEIFKQEGIDPERVEFTPRLPRREYFELYHRIDIGLDSFPYNGHTTSLDSLWMGVPVVTLMGQTVVSRAGFCLLSNLHIEELAARTPEQFVTIAKELATNLQKLRALRATLRRRMEQSPLMDAPKFARSIEAAYRQMWRSWCEAASIGNP